MKIKGYKKWWFRRSAEIEGDSEVGAGVLPNRPNPEDLTEIIKFHESVATAPFLAEHHGLSQIHGRFALTLREVERYLRT